MTDAPITREEFVGENVLPRQVLWEHYERLQQERDDLRRLVRFLWAHYDDTDGGTPSYTAPDGLQDVLDAALSQQPENA